MAGGYIVMTIVMTLRTAFIIPMCTMNLMLLLGALASSC